MWECGLKLIVGCTAHRPQDVTPYVGVWIETHLYLYKRGLRKVTPYVGVWIETQ